jgi:hypothetical protein
LVIMWYFCCGFMVWYIGRVKGVMNLYWIYRSDVRLYRPIYRYVASTIVELGS